MRQPTALAARPAARLSALHLLLAAAAAAGASACQPVDAGAVLASIEAGLQALEGGLDAETAAGLESRAKKLEVARQAKRAKAQPFSFVLGGDPARQEEAAAALSAALFTDSGGEGGALHVRPTDAHCVSAELLQAAVRQQLDRCGLDAVIVLHEVDLLPAASLKGLRLWIKGDDNNMQSAQPRPGEGPPVLLVLAGQHGERGQLRSTLGQVDKKLPAQLQIDQMVVLPAKPEEDIWSQIDLSMQPLLAASASGSGDSSGGGGGELAERLGFPQQVVEAGFVGQSWAVETIGQLIENRLLGFDRSKAPLVLVFTGPSGVGKTQLAAHMADILHGAGEQRADCFVQLQMNQYQDERSIDSLIGPPVGVVGEGHLTGALRKCPTAVVLLDEFEKAHPRAIPDVFLGAFDANANLVDTKSGLAVPTSKATFILTSNFGAELILQEQVELLSEDSVTQDAARGRVRSAVERAMAAGSTLTNPFARSEFRGRLRATAIFTPFSRPEQQQVAEKGLSDLQRHYYQDDGKRYKLGWAPAVPRYFSRYYGGPDGKQGLRPLLDSIDACDSLLLQAARGGQLKPGGGALFSIGAEKQLLLKFPKPGNEPTLPAVPDQEPEPATPPMPPTPPAAGPPPANPPTGRLPPTPPTPPPAEDCDAETGEPIRAVALDVDTEAAAVVAVQTATERRLSAELAAERERVVQLEGQVERLEERLAYYEKMMMYMAVAAVVAAVIGVWVLPSLFVMVMKGLMLWTLFLCAVGVAVLAVLAYYFPFIAKILRWLGGLIWENPRTAALLVFLVWLGLTVRRCLKQKTTASLEAQIAELESLLATERATVQRLMGEKGTGLKTGTLAKPGGNRARIDLAAVAAVQEPEAEAVAGAKLS